METNGAQPQVPYRVVVAIDFSTTGQGALSRAVLIANAHPHAEVHAVTVLEPHPAIRAHEIPADALTRLREMATRSIEELRETGGDVHVDRVVTHLLTGEPGREIVWLAGHVDADLVVMGTHGRKGVERFVLGSVAEHVLRSAGCPVLVVRPKAHAAETRQPSIEPPCEACVARQEATNGAERWCARHSEHHAHPHVYSWSEVGAGGFRPWGFNAGA